MATLRMGILVVIAVLASSQVWADELEEEGRRTLVGLSVVAALVEDLAQLAEQGGLSKSTLQTDVELRLRQAGIKVVSPLTTAEAANLYLDVNVVRVTVGSRLLGYAYTIDLTLRQNVVLLRDPSITAVFVATWKAAPKLKTVPVAGFASSVRGVVRDSVDEFINAYLAANPKR